MKLVKRLGVMAAVVMAATALVGVSSAGAADTVLCEVDDGTSFCPAGQEVTEVHLATTGPQVFLTTSALISDILCESVLWSLSILGLGNPQIAHFPSLSSMTWAGCHDATGVTPCTVTNRLLGLAEFLKTGPNLATASLPEMALRFVCGEIMRCTFSIAPGETLHAQGASETSNGHVTGRRNWVVPAATSHQPIGSICPESTWDALLASLTPVYVKS